MKDHRTPLWRRKQEEGRSLSMEKGLDAQEIASSWIEHITGETQT